MLSDHSNELKSSPINLAFFFNSKKDLKCSSDPILESELERL